MNNNSLEKGLAVAYRLLSHRARTEKQIREALDRRQFTQTIIEQVVAELKRKGYVNDRQYTRDYIDFRLQGKPYGPLWLRASLLRRGVAREIVEEELHAVISAEKERKLAQLFFEQIQSTLDSREKAFRRLLSRGFSYAAAQKVLKEVDFSSEK
ncbi:MAG: hypothetical protein GX357_09455 [Firmicutes bacterium]|nr:hypothetical protein [Bacillota bacterium]